jgi:hypothetical protein
MLIFIRKRETKEEELEKKRLKYAKDMKDPKYQKR